jgi:hypothetical protein
MTAKKNGAPQGAVLESNSLDQAYGRVGGGRKDSFKHIDTPFSCMQPIDNP